MSAYRLGAAAGVAAAIVVLLAACGQLPSGSQAATGSSGQSSAADNAAPAPADGQDADPDANMVSAVSAAGANGPVGVKFRIEARPVVGMPVKIIVALIPAANAQINHIHGSFLAGAGLTLQSERSFDVPEVHPGTALYRELTVVPEQTGVLNLNATILIQQDNGSQARTYSIPLIATDSST
jgi:hypothetical protein